MRAKTYPTFEDHGLIWIFWGEASPDTCPPKFFDNIDNSFSYMSFQQSWPVHYSRMVENQLDVMHLPYVHHNTIGRGMKTVVDGPKIRLQDDLLELWVYNRADDGRPARRADELPEPTRHPFLQFRFPNLWQNWISDDIRIVVAFVPVDEENTIMYGRYYQRVMRVPVLRELVNWIGAVSSIYIAGQDQRIVSFQEPKKSTYKLTADRPVQGDHAILTYRKKRWELKAQAGMEGE